MSHLKHFSIGCPVKSVVKIETENKSNEVLKCIFSLTSNAAGVLRKHMEKLTFYFDCYSQNHAIEKLFRIRSKT